METFVLRTLSASDLGYETVARILPGAISADQLDAQKKAYALAFNESFSRLAWILYRETWSIPVGAQRRPWNSMPEGWHRTEDAIFEEGRATPRALLLAEWQGNLVETGLPMSTEPSVSFDGIVEE